MSTHFHSVCVCVCVLWGFCFCSLWLVMERLTSLYFAALMNDRGNKLIDRYPKGDEILNYVDDVKYCIALTFV